MFTDKWKSYVEELPPKNYGTLSNGSTSSATLYEDQFSISKQVIEETIVEIGEITASNKFLAGISDAKFWLIFGCICWNELVRVFPLDSWTVPEKKN